VQTNNPCTGIHHKTLNFEFWTNSPKRIKTTLPRLFHKGINYSGTYHAEFPITRKNKGCHEQGHHDKEHITLNESPTPGSVDQGQ
jgi:hypothetical protein